MTPDGLSAVQSRISEIEQQLGIQRITVLTQPGAETTEIGSFDDNLVAALGLEDSPVLAQLRDATSKASGSTLTLDALRTQAGGVTASGIPLALERYGNGKIPEIALTPIGQDNHRLWDPAARAFNAMKAAAANDGIDISVSDAYRSYDEQVDIAKRKGLYSQGGLAAKPGTSDHGWGKALDINTAGGTVEWLRQNADKFGFVEDTPREPWHWVFEP